jgi:type II secretory pathway component GspD/PulD (secretin)
VSAPARILPLVLALLFFPGTVPAGEEPDAPVEPSPPAAVRVEDGRLSVEAEDAPFGTIMNEISRKAGFEVEVSRDVAGKTVSTSFTKVELERGIRRLFTLINHKNYFIHYAPDGSIALLEVKDATASGPARSTPPHTRTPRRTPRPRSVQPRVPPRPVPPPPAPPATERERHERDGGYVPPRRAPQYVPPRGGDD